MKKTIQNISVAYPLLVGLFIIAALFPSALFLPAVSLVSVPVARAASTFPQVGIQLSDVPSDANSVVSAGCYTSNNGIPQLTPAGGGPSAGAGDSNLFEEKCGQIYLSSSGTFSQDFQIGLRLGASAGGKSCDPALMTGANNFSYGPWTYTPWASQVGGANPWSPWISDNVGFDVDCYQMTVLTRPLPAGAVISNTQVGLQFGNGNGGSSLGSCKQPPGQVGWPVFSTGGWSENNPNPGTAGVAGTNGPGWTPGYDTTDCAQVFLTDEFWNGTPSGNNVSTTFMVNQSTTIGADGINPPFVAMQNNGSVAWYSDSKAPDPALGATTGTCDSSFSGFPAPNPTVDPAGASCSSWWAYSAQGASAITLQHTGSFTTNPAPMYFVIPVQVTVTVMPGGTGVVCLPPPLGCIPVTYPPTDAATYSQSTAIAPGSSAVFPMTLMQAPGTANPSPGYAETWQLYSPQLGGVFGTAFTTRIIVNGPPPPPPPPPSATGTIVVYSATATSTVTQVSNPIVAQVPYSSLLYSNGDKAGALYCPGGTIMSGIQSLGPDNAGTIIAGQPMCSNWTTDAITDGLTLTGSPYQIDSSANGGTLMCPAGQVVDGVEWAKNNQIDFGECETLSSTKGTVVLGSPKLITATKTYTDYYCPAGSLIVGGQNAPGKNDSWNGFYCAPITFTNTANTGSYLIPSSWTFASTNSDDPCATASCNNLQQQTYLNQATGTYTINPVYGSAGPTYAFRALSPVPIAKRSAPPSAANLLISFLKNAFTSVAKAFNFPVTNPQTQSLAVNGTANFVILWDPVAEISATPSSLALTDPILNGTIKVSNPGAVGSALNWSDAVSYSGGASGWLNIPSAGSVMGGSSQNVNVSVNTSTVPVGSCLSGSPCTATVTFSGTSQPNPPGGTARTPGGASSVSVTVTLTMTTPPTSVVIGPPSKVAACVPVTTTCSGGNGTYTWTASPGVVISGSGSSVTVSDCTPGSYNVTCTSAGISTSTQLTVVGGCTLDASPSVIVVPETSKLTWTCQPDTVSSCILTGGGNTWNLCNSVASCDANSGGSQSVSPAATTPYQLTCTANNDSPPSPSYNLVSTVSVTVQSPGRVETSTFNQ